MGRITEVLLMRWLRPHHLVLFNTVTTLLTLLCTYTISVSLGLVAPLFPSISMTGARPPASCLFSLLLNASAVFGVMVVYVRHRHIELHSLHATPTPTPSPSNKYIHIINDISMFLGVASWVGVMVVAAFQSTQALIPHYIGAAVAFACGNLYAWTQAYLTYLLARGLVKMVWVRAGLAALSTICLALVFLFVALAARFEGDVKDILHWKTWEGGYELHLVTDFSEWIMAIADSGAFLTLYFDFRGLHTRVHVAGKEQTAGKNNSVKPDSGKREETGMSIKGDGSNKDV